MISFSICRALMDRKILRNQADVEVDNHKSLYSSVAVRHLYSHPSLVANTKSTLP